MKLVRRILDRVEHPLLKRCYTQPRMQGESLDLRLDLSQFPQHRASKANALVRAEADFTFVPKVKSRRMVCGMGDAKIHSASCAGNPVIARVNAPYVVLKFARPVQPDESVRVTLRYTYAPDQFGTIRQPLTPGADFPQRVWLTCRRPLLAITQGRLVEGKETPPMRTYQWQSPRSRRLNAIVADVRSFKKETTSGMAIWLHLHEDSHQRAPRILDLLLEMYQESAEGNEFELPYSDFHVVESEDEHAEPFNSSGLIVVPRRSFRTDDRALVYGMVAQQFAKEWGRDALRLHSQARRHASGGPS